MFMHKISFFVIVKCYCRYDYTINYLIISYQYIFKLLPVLTLQSAKMYKYFCMLAPVREILSHGIAGPKTYVFHFLRDGVTNYFTSFH